ncbi:MAG: G8 domain-containing protein, partial [Burkholderiaceae bacterium]
MYTKIMQGFAAITLAAVLAGCGGGGGSSDTAGAPVGGASPSPSATPAPTPSVTASPAPTSSPAPSPTVSPPPPTSTADAGGWNNPATWGGTLPPDGAIVEIPAGKTVTLSGSTAKLGGLTIRGTLQFADADAQLTANWIAVHGALIAGSTTQPYTKKGTITLTGTDKKQDLFGMGTKGIMVMSGGNLQLHGEPRTGWTQLAATVQPGANSITLKDDMSTQWRAGDQLVIAPSSFEAEEYEVVTVTGVTAKTINFTPALKYTHWGELQTFEGKTLDQRAAVGLLTRNLVVRGGDDSDAINFGGHTMIMAGGKAQVTGVEFFKMGQRGLPGRYPLHWHLAGDRQGDFAKNNTVRNSFQRAMVLHGTDNLLLEGNVAFDITNHAFVWAEDGNEKNNRLIKNLAVFNKNPKASEFAFPVNNNLLGNSGQSEFRSGSFWGRSFAHTFIGNIAAGSVDGFGFFFDRFSADIVGDTEGSGLVFEDNIAHSNYRPGAGGVAAEIYPEATFGHGLMTTTNLNSKTEHVFKRFTGYKNYGGAWMEDRVTRLQDSILADNGTGTYIHRGKLDGVVIVGKSANTLGNNEFPPKGGFGSGAKGAIVVPSSHGGARAPQLLDVTVVNHDDAAYVVDVDDLGYGATVGKLKLVNSKS